MLDAGNARTAWKARSRASRPLRGRCGHSPQTSRCINVRPGQLYVGLQPGFPIRQRYEERLRTARVAA